MLKLFGVFAGTTDSFPWMVSHVAQLGCILYQYILGTIECSVFRMVATPPSAAHARDTAK